MVLEEEEDLKRQLLLRKLGSLVPENEACCATPDGKVPITVIDACPSWEIILGVIRSDAGEKSKTVTKGGDEKL